uniref:Regulatory protein E2 n=1 Tax=human papillomavirus 101 TaxID=915425 RepID=A0A7G2A579_9PAPI|nr:E2 protein [human papillomavirus 101]
METLVDRFDAVQDRLLGIYEAGRTDIDGQIVHWDLVRQEYVLLHYARKNGISTLGIQKVPSLATSESKAKQAILMGIVLKSLKDSAFGNEQWTLTDTSYELFMTPPSHTFKKQGKTIEVWYGNNEDNAVPYTLWNAIYYQDAQDNWYKARGQVSAEGLYYIDWEGNKHFYVRFADEATQFDAAKQWQVRTESEIISNFVTSTPPRSDPRPTGSSAITYATSRHDTRRTRRSTKRPQPSPSPSATSATESDTSGHDTRRRRIQQRKHKSQRPRWGSESPIQSPSSVGQGHRLSHRHYRSRLARLQEEARDPPVILIKGPANTTKCWRYRMKQNYRALFESISTAFSWVGDRGSDRVGCSRVLVAFRNDSQREKFLHTVKLPKGTQFSFGNLESL